MPQPARSFHLAQANVATMLSPLDDPKMAGFVERLDPLNALADATPGFVWRYESDDDDAAVRALFGNDRLLFNLTLWESLEALEAYVYRSVHADAVRKRREWFERPQGSPLVLWWIRAGTIPRIEDAKARFDMLESRGPSPEAFTFRECYDENGERIGTDRETTRSSTGGT